MIPSFCSKLFGPNWRSTAASLVAAGFGFIAFSPELFAHLPWLLAMSKYIALGGLVSLGISTKDQQAKRKDNAFTD
jgi:hypothetical protein